MVLGKGKGKDMAERVARLIKFPEDVDDKLRERSFKTRTPVMDIVVNAVERDLKKKRK